MTAPLLFASQNYRVVTAFLTPPVRTVQPSNSDNRI